MENNNMEKSKLSSLPEDKKKVLMEIMGNAYAALQSFEKNYPARLQKAREAQAKRDPLWDSW